MFNLRLRARILSKGKIAADFFSMLISLALFLSATLFALLFLLCLLSGTKTALGGWYIYSALGAAADFLLPLLFALLSLFLYLFYTAIAFYFKARVFFAFDKNQSRPKSFLRLSQALRCAACRALVKIYGLLWLCLFMLPFAFLSLFIFVSLNNKGLSPFVFYALLSLDFCFLLTGLSFFAVILSRYQLCSYLLFLNPLMPVRECISSCVSLSSGRLLAIFAARLSLLPQTALCLFILPAPFVLSYRRFFEAALSERLFGEDKRKAAQPAVTFYINKKSGFYEKGGTRRLNRADN